MTDTFFISHSRADAAYVRRLEAFLKAHGLRVWIDYTMLTGTEIPQEIARRIRECAGLVVVMTPAADASDWVHREIKHAQDRKKPILPLLLDGIPLVEVSTHSYEDVRGGRMPSTNFVDQLRSLTRSAALPPAASVSPTISAGEAKARVRWSSPGMRTALAGVVALLVIPGVVFALRPLVGGDTAAGDELLPSTPVRADAVALTGHTNRVLAVAGGRAGDHDIIISGGGDGTVRRWDAVTGAPIGDPLTGNTGWVLAVAAGRAGDRDIIVTGNTDYTVRRWDAITGDPIGDPLTGHTGEVNAVAVGRIGDRDIIVSGGLDGTVRRWDATTGDSIGDPLTGHTGQIFAVASAPAGDRDIIISGGSDGTVRVWDGATGDPIGDPLTGHTGAVEAVAAGRIGDRDIIISGGDDGTVRLWDAVRL